jgi:hypothetical protein
MTNEEKKTLILQFMEGPLRKYLTGDISFGRFQELINETFGIDFRYSDLYPSYLFNAKLVYEYDNLHSAGCPWYRDWHSCNCGAFDKK